MTIKPLQIQVKVKYESFPKLLPLSDFVADEGSYFSRFETCSSGTTVTELWKEVVKPYLDREMGNFSNLAVKTLLPRHLLDHKLPRKGNPPLHLQLSN